MSRRNRVLRRGFYHCVAAALCGLLVSGCLQVREPSPPTGGADDMPSLGRLEEEPVSEPEQSGEGDVSQEQVDAAMGQSGVDEVALGQSGAAPSANRRLDEYIANGDKLVALTFDDGPHGKHTQELLNYLAQEDIKATFFLVGVNMEQYPEVAPLIAQGGHLIGSHTESHVRLSKLDAEERKAEIEKLAERVESATGLLPFGLRPPYGDYDDTVAEETNLPIILWSVDPRDWEKKDAKAVSKHVIGHVQDGDIVLLHDAYGPSVEAVKKIVPALKKEGYRFVTVEELAYARGKTLEKGEVYLHMWPAC